MSTRMLWFAKAIFLCFTFISFSKAQHTSQCVPSSCGDILEIKFPFRLRTDPQHCGEFGYEIDCQNNQTIFIYKSRKFYVQEINYKSYSIRLLDPGLKNQQENCTVLPDHRASYGAMTSQIFQWLPVDNDINYVNCLAPINSSQYIPTSFCIENGTAPNSNFTYLVIKEILQESDLADGCKVETVAWSSASGISGNKSSLSSTQQGLAHGFELSWKHNFLCRACDESGGSCNLQEYSDTVTCRHYCSEDIPPSERSFRCRIEYYSVFVLAYGGIGLVARYVVGIPILIAVVVWQWKRRNLHISNDGLGVNACQSSSNEQNC